MGVAATSPSPNDLVLRVVAEHAEMLLGVARRHSACADDAQEAWARALEVFVRRAGSLDPDTAHHWLSVVVKREAWAVRRTRAQLVGVEPDALDGFDAARDRESPEERAEGRDDVARAAEALRGLKPQEVQALWLKAQGLSYAEIAERQDWTYTKVNRCITEGRRAFLRRYAGIEAGRECERWAPVLSALVDGEAAPRDLAAVRPHLRNCPACRALLGELRAAQSRIELVLPPEVLGAAVAVAGAGAGAFGTAAVTAGAGGSIFTGASKLAAIAATTLALAGGGAVVERSLPDRPSGPDAPEQVAGSPAPDPEPAQDAAAAGPSAVPVPERVGAPPAPEPGPAPARVAAAEPAEQEFEPAAEPAPAPAPAAEEFEPAVAAPAPAPPAPGEFAPVAPAPAPAPAPSAPPATEFGLG